METENPTIDCQAQTNNITGKILQNLVYGNLLLLEVLRDQKLRPYHISMEIRFGIIHR